MNNDNLKLQMALGFFIISGITVIMLMILYMTGGIRIDGNAYYVLVEMENIGDLKIGAPVKFGGIEIGKIKNMSIEDTHILLTAAIIGKYNIQRDSKPKISTMGLVGDAYLEFSRGVEREYLAKVRNPEGAVRLVGVPTGGMGEMMVAMQSIGKEVETMVQNVNALIGKEELRNNIERSIANIAVTTTEVVALLQNFQDTVVRINRSVDNVMAITVNAKNTLVTVDKFVGELFGNQHLADDLIAVLSSARNISDVLDQNKKEIAQTLKNISSTTGNVANITGSIKPGQGILRLISDEQAGAELMTTIDSLQRAVRSIATVGLSDIVADKYVGDKIAQTWLREHRGSSEQLAQEWKAWMSSQKRYAAQLPSASAARNYGGRNYYSAPSSLLTDTPNQNNELREIRIDGENYLLVDPEEIDSFYDSTPASSSVSSTKTKNHRDRSFFHRNKSAESPRVSAAPIHHEREVTAPERHPLENYYH